MNPSATKLGDVVDIIMGQAPPGDLCNTEGQGTIFVKAGEFGPFEPVIREWTTKPLKMAKVDDTLLCVVGATCGKVNFSSFDCAIGRSVAAIRPNQNKIDKNYLYHFLSTKVNELRRKSQGAAQGVINRDMILNIPLYLPMLGEQKRITAILNKAYELKVKREQSIDALDALAQSTFENLFNNLDGQLTALNSICKVDNGFAFKSENYDSNGDSYIVRISDIQEGEVTLSRAAKIYKSNVSRCENIQLKTNDILIAMSGATTGKIGVLEDIDGKSVFLNQRVGKYEILNESAITHEYLIELLKSRMYKQYVNITAAGAAQPNISTKQLLDFKFYLPPIDEQKRFSLLMKKIAEQKNKLKAADYFCSNLLSSIQHQAFSTGFN